MAGEVARVDEDHGVGDALWRETVLGEEFPQGQDVGGGLGQRCGGLDGVGLSVDDGEGFDLYDIEDAPALEGDDVGFEVGLVAGDGQTQYGVVEQGAGVRPAVCCSADAGAGVDAAQPQRGLVVTAGDAVDVLVGHLRHAQAQGLAEQRHQRGSGLSGDLAFEGEAVVKGKLGFSQRPREIQMGGESVFVDTGRIQQGAAVAARIGGQRRQGACIVRDGRSGSA